MIFFHLLAYSSHLFQHVQGAVPVLGLDEHMLENEVP